MKLNTVLALRCAIAFVALSAYSQPTADPELNQYELETRTYTAAQDWVTPYASNGPFCCPIMQLVSSGEDLIAATSSGYWVSANGETWGVVNRLPPQMLSSTGDALFIFVAGTGLMKATGGGSFATIRSPQGPPVTDITAIDDALYVSERF